MKNIYIVTAGYSPPLPGLDTWALGFQIQNQMLIKDKVLPLMKRKMDRLEISEYDDFYEDEPEGLNNANLLSREKCMAWMQSIADYLMDSEETDELDITLYEFSDRPEGFPTLSLPEVTNPWKRTNAAMFGSQARIEGASAPKSLAAKLPPVGASRSVQPRKPDATDNGAGPSKPPRPVIISQLPEDALETTKQLKIAGIRASLQYNGYPSNVIEDLIQNKLTLWQIRNRVSFDWGLKLPNGIYAQSYATIDANPYPGGKITEESARKCHKSDDCIKPFGHEGGCLLNAALDPNDPLNAQINRVTAMVRTALMYAGYPTEVVDSMMENDFRIKALPDRKSTKYRWSVKLFNGKRVNKLNAILKHPYPGGEVVKNPICPTVGCGRKIVKRGADTDSASSSPAKKESRAAFPSALPSRSILSSSSDDDEDLDGNEALFSEEEKSEDYAGSLRFSEPMEGDSSDSGQEEGLKNRGISRPMGLAAKVSPAGALRPAELGDALVGDDGAGPSRPPRPAKRLNLSQSALETAKQLKIAGIRASLQYNGYPPDVIEDLIQNKLSLYRQTVGNCFAFILKLPNGIYAQSYATVDANPYPGGKITEKSARKCHKSEACARPFGHTKGCLLNATLKLDTNDPLSLKIQHVTTMVRAALIYAGYPIEVVETTMENDFRIVALPDSKSNKYRWSLKLFNGKHVDKLGKILKHPYPGGEVVQNPVCHTVGCGKKFGHPGPCRGPNSRRHHAKHEADTDYTNRISNRPRADFPASLPSRSILSSSSDEEQEIEESDKEEEQEEPREEESPIYLLTTEEEEDSDFQGEDEYSSLYE